MDLYLNIMDYFMSEQVHLIEEMSLLVVSCMIKLSSLSNRVTTDRKDLRELLERTVLE